jgi:hypothetical protein
MADRRRSNEAMAIQIDNAISGTTSAPTAATEGIETPESNRERTRAHLELEKGSASGTREVRVKVYGYRSRIHTQDADGNNSTDDTGAAWFEIFDTGTLSRSANFNVSRLLVGAQDYDRLDTEVITNSGGGSETLTTAIAFGGSEGQ